MLNKRILVLMFVVAFLLVGCLPQPTNQVPVITSIPITAVDLGETYTYDVNATDPDGDTLTYSLAVKPTGMTIKSATGLVKWTPTKKGDHAVVVKVSDGDLDIIQSFTIVVSEVSPGYAPGDTGATGATGDTGTPGEPGEPGEPGKIELIGIAVLPKDMTLFVGDSDTIKSVTATYEIRGAEVPLPFSECKFTLGISSAKDIATVDEEGKISALNLGIARVVVTYKDKTDFVLVTVKPVAVGDNYGGGKVAYILVDDDTGYDANVQHGLIAATADQSEGAEWGCKGTLITGADGEAVGTGEQNTIDIETGCVTAGIAARLCTSYDGGNFDDWFLPSKKELYELYRNRDAIGGFATGVDIHYWSSTERNKMNADYQDFTDGAKRHNYKNKTYRVRAVRYF